MRKLRFILLLMGCFLLGVIIGYLNYLNVFSKFLDDITSLGWYWVIVIILVTFVINIAIHELGHLISMLKNKIKVRAVFILAFTFVKTDKIRIGIYPKLFKLVGGAVIPNIGEIKDRESYYQYVDAFKKVIKAGPFATISFSLFSVIFFIISLFFGNSALVFISFYFMVITLILMVLILISSKQDFNGLYGDYVAYEKLTTSKRFKILYILSACETSDFEKKNKKFLWNKIIKELEKSTEIHTAPGCEFLQYYCSEIVFNHAIGSVDIDSHLTKTYHLLKNTEEHYVLGHYLLYYYYVRKMEASFLGAKIKLDQIKRQMNHKMVFFWETRTNYLLGLSKVEAYKDLQFDATSTSFIMKPLYKYEKIEEKPLKI